MTRTITLDDDDEEAVEILLLHLYTLEDPTFQPASGSVRRAADVYVVSDKFQVQQLKAVARMYLSRLIRRNLPHWCEFCAQLKGKWIGSFEMFWSSDFPAIEEVRSAFLEQMVDFSKYMIEEPAFRKLLQENKEFNFDFITALAKKASK